MSIRTIPQITAGAAYRAIPDELQMNTDRFLRIIERLEARKKPRGEWCFVSLALTLSCLFPLVTTQTYRAALGFDPKTWEAFTLWGSLFFGAAFLGLVVRFGYIKLKFPPKSSEEILAEVIHQMELEYQRAAARAQELGAAEAVSADQPRA